MAPEITWLDVLLHDGNSRSKRSSGPATTAGSCRRMTLPRTWRRV